MAVPLPKLVYVDEYVGRFVERGAGFAWVGVSLMGVTYGKKQEECLAYRARYYAMDFAVAGSAHVSKNVLFHVRFFVGIKVVGLLALSSCFGCVAPVFLTSVGKSEKNPTGRLVQDVFRVLV